MCIHHAMGYLLTVAVILQVIIIKVFLVLVKFLIEQHVALEWSFDLAHLDLLDRLLIRFVVVECDHSAMGC